MKKQLEDFWKDKVVIITGHTGFKGSWLTLFLKHLGAEVHGISREKKNGIYEKAKIGEICSSENFLDISNFDTSEIEKIIKSISPDVVFHFAAQSLVIKSYEDPKDTIYSNIIGTYNIMESVNASNCRSLVIATTDKVYKYPEKNNIETSELGGKDFYSSTKVSAELLIQSYISSAKRSELSISVVRSGNVIGGGDRSENRLLTDLVDSLLNSTDFHLRMPKSIRPWQYILDSLSGYLLIAERTFINNESEIYNLNSDLNNSYNTESIAKLMIQNWGTENKIIIKNEDQYKEVKELVINSGKAKEKLDWVPKYEMEEIIQEIINWEKNYIKVEGPEFSLKQIKKYIEKS